MSVLAVITHLSASEGVRIYEARTMLIQQFHTEYVTNDMNIIHFMLEYLLIVLGSARYVSRQVP